MHRLRLALVSPPWFPVPPRGYGGIETIVHLLAHELEAGGHEVTVFGAAGSDPDLDVVSLSGEDWSRDLGTATQRVREATYLQRVYERLEGGRFDLIHDHNEYTGMLVAGVADLGIPVVATVHGGVGPRESEFLQSAQRRVALVAISQAQAEAAPDVDWAAVVHNAVDPDAVAFSAVKGDYLLVLARITPDKGQRTAIEVSRRAGMPLVLAGKLDPDDEAQEYFEMEVQPHLGQGVRWVPNVEGEEKKQLLAGARAMLFPIEWNEPFGLAMVEAMASGTPVIAFPRGAAREVVEPGVTGFLARDAAEMVELVSRVEEIDPERCRQRALDRFSPGRMAVGYEAVYAAAVQRRGSPPYPSRA